MDLKKDNELEDIVKSTLDSVNNELRAISLDVNSDINIDILKEKKTMIWKKVISNSVKHYLFIYIKI